MKYLMKFVWVTAPIFGLVFLYIIFQQFTALVEMVRSEAVMDQNMYHFDLRFADSKEERSRIEKRISLAEKRETAAEAKSNQATKDNDEFREAFKEAGAEEGIKKARTNDCRICHKGGKQS